MQSKAVSNINKYPDKPITMIVPFGVGGGVDLVARAMEKKALQYLGQPITVVNKPALVLSAGMSCQDQVRMAIQ
ncbi:MAG: hypothetical protein ABFC57_14450 [Veillonellales bacterium]